MITENLSCGRRWLGRAAGFWPLAILVLFAGHNWFGPDIWYHLAWGREIVAQRTTTPVLPTLLAQPLIVNSNWLFQTIVFAVYTFGGPYACGALFVTCWFVIGLLWMKTVDFRYDRAATYLPVISFIACVQLRLEYRPEVFTYLAILIMTGVLRNPMNARRKSAILFLVQVIWTNVHSYFFLGPVIASIYGLASASSKDSGHGRRLADLRYVPVVLAATAVSPAGLGSWSVVYRYAILSSGMRDTIEELLPTTRFAWWYWPMPIFWVSLSAVVGLALYRLGKRRDVFAALVGLLGAASGLMAFRNIPLVALCAAPLWRRAVGGTVARTAVDRVLVPLFILSGVALSFGIVTGGYYRWTGSYTAFGMRVEPAEYPSGAADYLSAHKPTGRLFNDPGDGGYLEFNLPRAKVLGDSYYADPALTATLFRSRTDVTTFDRLDDRLHFDAAVLPVTNSRMVSYLIGLPNWVVGYADFHRIVLVRNTAGGNAAFDFSAARYASGEDLRRPSYLEPAVAWFQFAFARGPELMDKLVQDFDPSPHVPSDLVKSSLAYAVRHHDRNLATKATAWRNRMFVSNPDDPSAIDALTRSLGQF